MKKIIFILVLISASKLEAQTPDKPQKPYVLWCDTILYFICNEKKYSYSTDGYGYYKDQKINNVMYLKDNDLTKERNDIGYSWCCFRDMIKRIIIEPSFAQVKPKTTKEWFLNFKKLKTIVGLEFLNTTDVADMYGMFLSCENLEKVNLSNFDTSKVTDMRAMFMCCKCLTSLDLRNFNTSNVTDMDAMFRDCNNLKEIDLSHLETSNVNRMAFMFYGCKSLTSLDVNNFNTSKVTDMQYMFSHCSSLKSLDLSNFDTSIVNNMRGMFWGCSTLTTIYCNDRWTCDYDNSYGMFNGCGNLVGGWGTKCMGGRSGFAHPDGGESNPGYFTGTGYHKNNGDVNGDGFVDISDVVAIIRQISGTTIYKRANVNGDNTVDISDVVAVINIVARK